MDIGSITLTELLAGGAIITSLVALFKNVSKPITEFTDRIEKLEAHQDADNKRLKVLEEDSKMTLKTLNAILGHLQTGNETKEMSKQKKELEEYIISR